MEWRRRRPRCPSLLWPNVKIDPSHSHLFFLVEQTLVWAQNLGFHPKLREYPNSVSRRACPKRSPTCCCMQSNQSENSIIIPSTGLEFFLGSSDGRGWLLASQSAWTRLRLSWLGKVATKMLCLESLLQQYGCSAQQAVALFLPS